MGSIRSLRGERRNRSFRTASPRFRRYLSRRSRGDPLPPAEHVESIGFRLCSCRRRSRLFRLRGSHASGGAPTAGGGRIRGCLSGSRRRNLQCFAPFEWSFHSIDGGRSGEPHARGRSRRLASTSRARAVRSCGARKFCIPPHRPREPDGTATDRPTHIHSRPVFQPADRARPAGHRCSRANPRGSMCASSRYWPARISARFS